jgi:hypothetical protein
MEKRVYTYCSHANADLIIAVNVDNGTYRSSHHHQLVWKYD